MEGGGGGANHTKKLKISSLDQPLDSIFASATSNSFLGSRAMVSFGDVGRVNGSGNSFYQSFDPQENGDEYMDDYLNQQEKKKRLSVDQVQFLERSFEVENKLEPERKNQLANELSLQPRQIAVWFQNRRARWKTKQLETEYETLHANYKSLKTNHDILLKENEKLKYEVFHLKHNGVGGDIKNADSGPRDTKEVWQETQRETVADRVSIGEESKVSALASKNDDHSDVSNADGSPWLTDEIRPLLLESGDSSHVFESDILSDLSRNGEDSLSDELLQRAYVFHKIEDAYCHTLANSRGYGFSLDDHALGFWSY